MSFHLVCAKYNENVSWLNYFSTDTGDTSDTIFIYNKSSHPVEGIDLQNVVIIPRQNVGREVASFIEHIILHYDNLPDYTIFVQGDPFPHLSPQISPEDFPTQLFDLINTKPDTITPLLTTWHTEQHGHYPSILSKEYYEFFFNTETVPETSEFAAGCQYIVPKRAILYHYKRFYEHLHSMTLLGDKYTSDQAHYSIYPFSPFEINGWTLERLLGSIFSQIPIHDHFNTIPRYLVSGGAGFIGSNLVDELVKSSKVYVIDNLSTGSVDNIIAHPNMYFIKDDITTTDFLSSIGYIDGIFHLAAMSKVLPSLENPEMVDFCLQQNVQGTIKVLKHAQRHQPPIKVVYSASSTMYGNNPPPHSESQPPDCQTPYATSKYCGELYCDLFSRLYNVPTVRLRYFMVYGPREPSSGSYAIVTGIFKRRKQQGLPLEIHGDGSQSRDFVHVQDIAKANILAMNKQDLYSATINVGTGTSISIKDIALAISDDVVYTEKRKVDLQITLADTSFLQTTFDWVPNSNILYYLKHE